MKEPLLKSYSTENLQLEKHGYRLDKTLKQFQKIRFTRRNGIVEAVPGELHHELEIYVLQKNIEEYFWITKYFLNKQN